MRCDAYIARSPNKGKLCGTNSKPRGSGVCGKHQEKLSTVPRRQQPDRHLPTPEAVGGEDDILWDDESDEEVLPVFDVPEDVNPPVEHRKAAEGQPKVVGNAHKINEAPCEKVFECVHRLDVGNDNEVRPYHRILEGLKPFVHQFDVPISKSKSVPAQTATR